MLKLENLSKYYYNKGMITSGLNSINLQFDCGEFVAITGESGSGKSTLLNVIAGLDSYEDGEMLVNGNETSHFSQEDMENYRKSYIGNIFQNFNLINSYTVYKNIELGLLLNKYDKNSAKARILKIIDQVGLAKFKNTRVSKLSGGQKQRVAIARVLARETPILLADEPTGNLDQQSAQEIIKLLSDIAQDKLVIVVTHEYSLIEKYVTRKIAMSDGNVLEDQKIKKVNAVDDAAVEAPSVITSGNKLRVGLRNTFNLFVKFGLLLIVFLILISGVLTQYASFKYKNKAQEDFGYNMFFMNVSGERLIVNREDREQFTDKQLRDITMIPGVAYIVENDMVLDIYAEFNTYDQWFYGGVRSVDKLDSVDYGRLPIADDEIAVTVMENDFFIINIEDSLDKEGEFMLWQFGGKQFDKNLKIVGIKKVSFYSDRAIYICQEYMNILGSKVNRYVSKIETTLNKQVLENEYGGPFYGLIPSDKVPQGQIYVSSDMNYMCKNNKCRNKSVSMKVSNLYYEDTFNGKITRVIKSKGLRDFFSLGDDWRDYTNAFFMNPQDYDKLFKKPSYQISLFLEDIKYVDAVSEQLIAMGFKGFNVKASLYNYNAAFNVVLMIFNTIAFGFIIGVLFFVSYFVIRLIMRSRQPYYAVVRILGGSKKVVRDLVTIELFTICCIAFIAVFAAVTAFNLGYIQIPMFADTLKHIKTLDFVIMYIVAIAMAIWISNRISNSLFEKSAVQAYREGVQQ